MAKEKKGKENKEKKNERKASYKPRLGLALENAVLAVNDAEEDAPKRHVDKAKREGSSKSFRESSRLKGREYSYYFAGQGKGILKGLSARRTQHSKRKSVKSSPVMRTPTYTGEDDGEYSDTTEEDEESDRESMISEVQLEPTKRKKKPGRGNNRKASVRIDVVRENRQTQTNQSKSRFKQLTGNIDVSDLSVAVYLGKQAQKHLTSGDNYGLEFGTGGNKTVSLVRYESYTNRVRGRTKSRTLDDQYAAKYTDLLNEAVKYELKESDWPPAAPTVVPGPPAAKATARKKIVDNLSKVKPTFFKRKQDSDIVEHVGFRYLVFSDAPVVIPPPPDPKQPPLDGSKEQQQLRQVEMLQMACEDFMVKVVALEEKKKSLKAGMQQYELKIRATDNEISKLIPGAEFDAKEVKANTSFTSQITGRRFEVEKLQRN